MQAPTVEEVASLVEERLGAGVEAVEPLEGGAWSRAFGVRHRGQSLVVRFSAVEDDFRKDERAARHRSAALPVPVVHEIGRAFGGWYAITDRHTGRYLEDADDAAMRAVLPSLFDTLDALRAADVSDTTGFGGWDHAGNGIHPSWRAALLAIARDEPGRRIHGWSARLAAYPDEERAFAAAHEALERTVTDLPDARHLVHSDLLNRNVLVSDDRISAVLDWGSAFYGDFLFDLAWLTFWQPWYRGWGGVDVRAAALAHHDRIGLEVPDLDRRLRACELYIALDGMSYLAWAGFEAPLVWTARRTAAVLERGSGPRS